MKYTSSRQGKEKMKPLAVVDYDKQREVDHNNQQLLYGALEHKTQWWRK
jgi:hypothetical protein